MQHQQEREVLADASKQLGAQLLYEHFETVRPVLGQVEEQVESEIDATSRPLTSVLSDILQSIRTYRHSKGCG